MNSVRDLFEDPQVKARENIVAVPEPGLGQVHMPGVVPRSDGHARARSGSAGPREPGADNEEIYLGRLGLERAEFDRLRAAGVVSRPSKEEPC